VPAMLADRRRTELAVPRASVMSWETVKEGMA
jgi:hypothetical protein